MYAKFHFGDHEHAYSHLWPIAKPSWDSWPLRDWRAGEFKMEEASLLTRFLHFGHHHPLFLNHLRSTSNLVTLVLDRYETGGDGPNSSLELTVGTYCPLLCVQTTSDKAAKPATQSYKLMPNNCRCVMSVTHYKWKEEKRILAYSSFTATLCSWPCWPFCGFVACSVNIPLASKLVNWFLVS